MAEDASRLSFEADVQPMFRAMDRQEMLWALDLWKHEDVAANGQEILDRLEAGEMPCDEPWPADRVAKFRSWVEGGMP